MKNFQFSSEFCFTYNVHRLEIYHLMFECVKKRRYLLTESVCSIKLICLNLVFAVSWRHTDTPVIGLGFSGLLGTVKATAHAMWLSECDGLAVCADVLWYVDSSLLILLQMTLFWCKFWHFNVPTEKSAHRNAAC